MRSAIEDLRLDALHVVYPGERAFAMDSAIHALPITELTAFLGRTPRT